MAQISKKISIERGSVLGGTQQDGANIMLAITPIVIELMLGHPEEVFGDIMYPVV